MSIEGTMKFRLFVLAALVTALGITLIAQQRGQRGGRGGGPDVVAQTRDALNLSPDQVERLRAMLDARAQSQQSAQDNLQAKIDALATANEKSPKDAVAIDGAAQG